MSDALPLPPDEVPSEEVDFGDWDEDDFDEVVREPGLCPGCARAPQEWATGLCISCVSVRYQRRADYDEPKEQREASANA